MPRLRFLALLLVAGCSGAGSTGVQYDADADRTTFRSAAVPLGRSATGAIGASSALVLRAAAECEGAECVPATYTLTVSNPGPNEVASNYNQVVFSTPEGTVSFEPSASRDSNHPVTFFSSGRGELFQIEIPLDIFASFAMAETLSIRFGSQEFTLPYATRSPLRGVLSQPSE